MTILIAHRGNFAGPDPVNENQVEYLFNAISHGYDVEIDVWYYQKQWRFGHDGPHIPVATFILNELSPYAWFHAKNKEAYEFMAHGYNVFEHDQAPFAITSKGVKWSHNGLENPGGIVVMPNLETEQHLIRNCKGVCHDYLTTVECILQKVD